MEDGPVEQLGTWGETNKTDRKTKFLFFRVDKMLYGFIL